MASTNSFLLKVTPEELQKKSAVVSALIKETETAFNEISKEIKNTKKYWIGLASEKHQQLYLDQEDEITEVIKRLKEHPTDLLTMAGVYKQAEKDNISLANTLQADIIE